jgi:uncharacterized protein YbjT (DUF2867 family)
MDCVMKTEPSAPNVTNRSAVLLGASGLVGGHLCRLLTDAASYSAVTLLTRRALGLEGGKVREAVIDFERPESFRAHLAVDDVFCCLGTTIKKAGSQEAFRKVDLEAPVAVAGAARAANAQQFLIVTAVGADAQGRVFYSRVKGEVEQALRALEFPRGLKIFRPSMLLGERTESRPAERMVMAVMRATRPAFAGGLARYRAIDAADVAGAMLRAATQESESGVEVYEGERLFALAGL